MLQSVLDTEITPELVPTGEDEELQSSEAKVGPYALQDFSLFHVLRYGFRPSKIAFLAWHAWSDADGRRLAAGLPAGQAAAYSLTEIRHWLQVFVQRFYSFSQFKRSAMPNGPKVSHGGSLSPRGDWRAPSDMSARIWLDEIERNDSRRLARLATPFIGARQQAAGQHMSGHLFDERFGFLTVRDGFVEGKQQKSVAMRTVAGNRARTRIAAVSQTARDETQSVGARVELSGVDVGTPGSITATVCSSGRGSGTSTSSMISTSCWVCGGMPPQLSCGELSAPTPFPALVVGMAPSSSNSALVR